MKKIILSVMMCAMGAFAFAQQGTFEVGGAVSFSTSKTTADTEDGGDLSKDTKFDIMPEFMYYVTDKIAVGAGIGFSYEKEGIDRTTKTSLFKFRPTVRYSVALTENFKYTPQLYIGMGFGSEKNEYETEVNETTITHSSSQDKTNIYAGITLVRFEFMPTSKIGLAFSCGNLEYNYENVKDATKTNTFNLGVNLEPTLGFFYRF